MLTIGIFQPDLRGLLRLGMTQLGMVSVVVSISKGQYAPQLHKIEVKSNRPLHFCPLSAQDTPGYHRIYHKNDGICGDIPTTQTYLYVIGLNTHSIVVQHYRERRVLYARLTGNTAATVEFRSERMAASRA